jgi:phospholipase C
MIEHVFVLMLENRSFDHMLGFAGLAGIDAGRGGPTHEIGLNGTESNRLTSGETLAVSTAAPFALSIDPGHEFDDVLEQLCGAGAVFPDPQGKYPPVTNSGFASRLASQIARTRSGSSPALAMSCFGPRQLPVLTTLASEFALCDHWFSSLPGPTWPNRFFVHAASSGGLDSSPDLGRSLSVLLAGYRFAGGTLFDRLDRAGLKWSVVEGDAFPQVLAVGGMVEQALEGRFVRFPDFLRRLDDPDFSDAYVFIEPNYGHVLEDGRNFKCGNSQHPLDDVTRGETLIKDVYEAIRTSPHWPTSLLVVTYDEHGGFYDHVPPPPATPPGDGIGGRFGFGFDQLGVRVPAVIVSPLIPRGLIDHSVYDHSSVPATVEGLFGLMPLTSRDAAANRFDHLLSESPRTDAPLQLPAAVESGINECDDTDGIRLAAELESIPAHLAGDIEPALVGFVQVALGRELHLAAMATGDVGAALDREHDRLLTTYQSLRTKFDALRYLRQVELRYQEAISKSGY